MKLEIRHLACGYPGHQPILNDVNFVVESGEICCLLGPNGVGKTTLFKSVMRFLKPLQGEVRINGENIQHWSVQRMAKVAAYVAQVHVPPFPYLVQDVVMLGRISSTGYLGQPSRHDREVAVAAMEDMGIAHLRKHPYTDISGGERQLVMLARALAQEPQLLVLDEPTANLDYGNILRVTGKIRELRDKNLAVIMTTHLPDQAFMVDANVVLLQQDRPMLFGRAAEIVTERNLQDAYGVQVKVVEYLAGEQPMHLCAPVFKSNARSGVGQYS